ncbi:MAG TPA: DnaJ domain-containing protein [Chthoniobacteraceae bacterium]|nr:DnaJ domain-containing protein [Chthoniobacteraceae bacterium]
MTDCFALLGVPRRPWLDAGALKERFHELGAEHHPDVAKTDAVDFAAINAAYNTLLDPKTRVKHLLELEFPEALKRNLQIPRDIAILFEVTARDSRNVAAFRQRCASVKTRLEIAMLYPDRIALLGSLQLLQEILAEKRDEIFARLKSADANWERDKAACVDPLLEIHQSLSYVGKWLAQVEEDLVRLKET